MNEGWRRGEGVANATEWWAQACIESLLSTGSCCAAPRSRPQAAMSTLVRHPPAHSHSNHVAFAIPAQPAHWVEGLSPLNWPLRGLETLEVMLVPPPRGLAVKMYCGGGMVQNGKEIRTTGKCMHVFYWHMTATTPSR